MVYPKQATAYLVVTLLSSVSKDLYMWVTK